MSVKDELAHIRHIVECIERIEDYIGPDKREHERSRMVYDALLRNLQTMSESASKLAPATQAGYPAIEWKKIAAFRNVIAHDYLGDYEPHIFWDVLQHKLPELKTAMLEEMKKRTNT